MSASQVIAVPTERTRLSLNADARNIVLLLAGFGLMVALIPPIHSYPVIDDWAYARSVDDLLHWQYAPHSWVQATSIAHIAWGALFVMLFGSGFTVLTTSTLVMSATCLVVFYALGRESGLKPGLALLGSALLGVNPLFVHLSYSFMTDVSFLAFLLAGALCYMRGIRLQAVAWLWAGSIFTALAFLTRQYGIILAGVVIAYVLFARKGSWRQLISIALVPTIVAMAYYLWERTQPTPIIAHYYSVLDWQADLLNPVKYAGDRAIFTVWVLLTPSLCLVPLISRPRKILLLVPALFLILIPAVWSAKTLGTLFPRSGSVVDIGGYNFLDYQEEPLWSQPVWLVIGLAALFALGFLLAWSFEQVPWLAFRRLFTARSASYSNAADRPVGILFWTAALMLAVSLVGAPGTFDRYVLPGIPMMTIALLLYIQMHYKNGSYALALRFALVIPIAIFALVGQRDYAEHADTRWQAAQQLAARGVERRNISAGFEWAGWYLYDEGVQHLKETGQMQRIPFPPYAIMDAKYKISDLPVAGYVTIERLPYSIWLEGGATHYVLVLQRTDTGK